MKGQLILFFLLLSLSSFGQKTIGEKVFGDNGFPPVLGEKHTIDLSARTHSGYGNYYASYEYRFQKQIGLLLSVGTHYCYQAGLRIHLKEQRGGLYLDSYYQNSFENKMQEVGIDLGFRLTNNDSYGVFCEFGYSNIISFEEEVSERYFEGELNRNVLVASIGLFF